MRVGNHPIVPPLPDAIVGNALIQVMAIIPMNAVTIDQNELIVTEVEQHFGPKQSTTVGMALYELPQEQLYRIC